MFFCQARPPPAALSTSRPFCVHSVPVGYADPKARRADDYSENYYRDVSMRLPGRPRRDSAKRPAGLEELGHVRSELLDVGSPPYFFSTVANERVDVARTRARDTPHTPPDESWVCKSRRLPFSRHHGLAEV